MIKKIFSIALTLFISLPLISCKSKNERGFAYRIVDAKGKTVEIERKVPELNAQFLPEDYVTSKPLEETYNDEDFSTPVADLDNNYEEFDFEESLQENKDLNEKTDNTVSKRKVIPVKKKETPEAKDKADELKLKPKTTKTAATKPTTNKKAETVKKAPAITNPHYVQIGAYSVKTSAENLKKEYSTLATTKIKVVKINNKSIHRVLLGPVNSRTEAEALLNKVIKKGRYDAFITQR